MSSASSKNTIIIKNTGLLYVRMLFTMIVSLFTSRIVLKTLGVDDFGIYNVVGSIVSSFLFLNMALSTATQRFLTFELGKGNLKRLKQLFSASVTIYILVAVIVLIVTETIGLWFVYNYLNIPTERFDSALWVYQFSILTSIISIIQTPYNASIIANEKMGIFAYFSIIEVTSTLILVYLLTLIDFDKLKLYAMLIFILKIGISYMYRTYCRIKFKECTFKINYDKNIYKELISYTSWNLFGNLSSIVKVQGVNILLNVFFGPIINTARGIAFQIQNAVNGFVLNFQTAMHPQIIKSYAINDKKYMMSLIYNSSKFSFFLLFLITLPILLETEYILNLWLGFVPEYSVIFTFLILINALIDCISGSLMAAFHATGKIKKYQVIVGVLTMFNLPLSFILLKLGFPPEITLYISITLSIIAFFIRFILLKKLIDMSLKHFFNKVLSKLLLVTILSIIIPILLVFKLEYGFFRFIIVSTTSICTVILSIYFFGVKPEEKKYILKMIKSFKN